MEEIGYNRNDIEMLYEINKKAEMIVDTTVGQTESINIKEIVKQGSIFRPIMCCVTSSKVNNIGRQCGIVTEKLILECQFTWMT